MLENFEQYQKTTIAYFRDYAPGENLNDVRVCHGVVPCAGGKIGVDPANTIDQWYVSPEALARYYKKVEPIADAELAETTATKLPKSKAK
jgi:hypothetical protein